MKNALSLVLIMTLALCAKAHTLISDSDTTKIYTVVQKYPEFPGGESKFQELVKLNQIQASPEHRSFGGDVNLQFIVEKDGTLSHFKIIGHQDRFCSKEAIRLLKLSPNWHPGMINGVPVCVLYNYTVHLIDRTFIEGETTLILTDSELYSKVFVAVEHEPEFVGGMEKFQEYIKGNLQYPPLALNDEVEGKVFIHFIVEKGGSLTDIKVVRGIGNGCDEEAIRLMKKCPKWKPGIQNGRNVRVEYMVPITFTLPEKN